MGEGVVKQLQTMFVLRLRVEHSARLVEQASFVSNELIRVAILWHESWHESLEEASRLWFGQTDIEGMFKVLDAAHARMDEVIVEAVREKCCRSAGTTE